MTTPDWVLQQRRSELMEALYQVSGRTNGLMTGLWHGAALELAAHMRDKDRIDCLELEPLKAIRCQ